jgi:hypothetical protein
LKEDGVKTYAAVLSVAFLAAGMASLRAGTLCPDPTNCTLVLDVSNASSNFGTGDFGTVNLLLDMNTNTVTVTVTMDSGWVLVNTGAGAATIGFVDSLGGGLAVNSITPSQYTGYSSVTGAYSKSSWLHYNGFGYANDGVGLSGPSAGGNTSQTLSFIVSDGTLLTNVNQLVNPFVNGSPVVYFTADVYNGVSTGLVGADGRLAGVPEPATAALLALGGILLFGLRFRFAKK